MTYELLILTLSFQKAAKKLSYVFEISTFIPYFHSKLFYLSFELIRRREQLNCKILRK